MAEQPKFIEIRERSPRDGSLPGNTIDVSAETPCTRALPGNELDVLREDGRGGLHPYDDAELWRGPIVTLADCSIGELVFARIANSVASAQHWHLCEVMSELKLRRG